MGRGRFAFVNKDKRELIWTLDAPDRLTVTPSSADSHVSCARTPQFSVDRVLPCLTFIQKTIEHSLRMHYISFRAAADGAVAARPGVTFVVSQSFKRVR